jgi:TonB family protein
MVHGITGYFLERARCARRLSLLTAALGLAGLAGLMLAYTPPVRKLVTRVARFGYEGPDQYVRRINLMQVRGEVVTLSDVGGVRPVSTRRGGGEKRHVAREGQPVPAARFKGAGASDADADLAARLISRLSNVPVVQSEDLVIDRLVKPIYPTHLLERNIEGKVTVQALIDTVGKVVEVQVLASTGETLFERAAEEAVWQCRFRPYRQDGGTSEVYAVFRFAFRIY